MVRNHGAEQSKAPAQQSIRRGIRVRFRVAIVSISALLTALLILLMRDPTMRVYRFQNGRIVELVDHIKSMDMPMGQVQRLRVSHSLDPLSLAYRASYSDMKDAYPVSVFRGSKSNYMIEITLDDEGHFGTYGLIYCDTELPLKQRAGFEFIENGPLLDTATKRLSSKWWYGENHSD